MYMTDPNIKPTMNVAIVAKITTSLVLACLLCQVWSDITKILLDNTRGASEGEENNLQRQY